MVKTSSSFMTFPSGTPFKSGTSITTVQLVTPGSATSATPFDTCFLGISIQ